MRILLKSTALALTLSISTMGSMAAAQINPLPGTNQGATPGINPNAGRGNNPRTASGNERADSQVSSEPAKELVEMNNAEVALAKKASTKAQSPAVKSFADMIVKDHTAALTKLRDVEGVRSTKSKPNAKHKATADRLAKLSGAEFDREYMAVMVADHQETLAFLERQSTLADSNPSSGAGKKSLAEVSEEMIPTVREHLEQAQKIQRDLGANSQLAPGSNSTNSGTPNNTGAGNSNRTNGTGNGNRGSASPAPGAPAGGNR